MRDVIVVEQARKSYFLDKTEVALRGLNLVAKEGEFTTLAGPSLSGTYGWHVSCSVL